ncbi:TolB family protein [Alteribacillus sp. HJP-4]|uniref:TolB family protein n=1 Tax=Alteribacillus sp. HJP-4 TaxID=2775394 RepID=UPI0035CD1E47
MKSNRVLLVSIITIIILLAASILISVTYDSYRFYNGLAGSLAMSPDDEEIAFSYYENGDMEMYTSNREGNHIEQVSHSPDGDVTNPEFSPDGEELLYLSASSQRVSSIFIQDRGTKKTEQITGEDIHIEDAVFSPDSEMIYYIGIAAEDWQAEDGEAAGGFDLFAYDRESETTKQLSKQNYYIMDNLSVDPNNSFLLYSSFEEDTEEVMSFSLNDDPDISTEMERFTGEVYNPTLSPDGEALAYSVMVDNSVGNDSYEYELFLFDTDSGNRQRLTNTNTNVEAPVFFHEDDRMLFLKDRDWPEDPVNYSLHSINLDNRETERISINGLEEQGTPLFYASAAAFSNRYVAISLYSLLGILLTIVWNYRQKTYRPAVTSFVLSSLLFLSSLFSPLFDPWGMLGLGNLAGSLAVCSLIILAFAYILKRFRPAP